MTDKLLAGIEAGGTKFVCGVARGPDEILRTISVATDRPESTMARVAAFFEAAAAEFGPVTAGGCASFGPIDLDRTSASHGCLVNTPKPGWSGFNLVQALERLWRAPVSLDTDVAGAGLAEWALGAGRGLEALAYVTVGTGVGGALIVDGRPAHRAVHPEMGHISPRRHGEDLAFAGVCPFHGDCLEGLASGPAIVERFGAPLSDLAETSPAWRILPDYLAQLCRTITLIGAPGRIVLGGGVMSNTALYGLTRAEFLRQSHGYLSHLSTPEAVEAFIAPPALGGLAGLTGALLLADRSNPA